MSEFTADVELKDIVVRDTNISDAVDEPFRAMILDMLAEDEMTVSEIHRELSDRGFDRRENTVRHHVNELRDAGLVEVSRFEERRGGTSKYYRANTIVLSYVLSEAHNDTIDEMAIQIKPHIEEVISQLRSGYGTELEQIATEMGPCQHCKNQKYETYLLLTVLRRAFVRAYAEEARESI